MLSQLFFLYLSFRLGSATVVVEPSLLQQVKGEGLDFVFPVSVELLSCCPAALHLLPTYTHMPVFEACMSVSEKGRVCISLFPGCCETEQLCFSLPYLSQPLNLSSPCLQCYFKNIILNRRKKQQQQNSDN